MTLFIQWIEMLKWGGGGGVDLSDVWLFKTAVDSLSEAHWVQ